MTEHLRKAWWPGLQVDYRILDRFPCEPPGIGNGLDDH